MHSGLCGSEKRPGDEPVHCANGWYRRRSGRKFSTEEMTDHKNNLTDAQFVVPAAIVESLTRQLSRRLPFLLVS